MERNRSGTCRLGLFSTCSLRPTEPTEPGAAVQCALGARTFSRARDRHRRTQRDHTDSAANARANRDGRSASGASTPRSPPCSRSVRTWPAQSVRRSLSRWLRTEAGVPSISRSSLLTVPRRPEHALVARGVGPRAQLLRRSVPVDRAGHPRALGRGCCGRQPALLFGPDVAGVARPLRQRRCRAIRRAIALRTFSAGRIQQHGVVVNLASKRAGPIDIDPRVWGRFGFPQKPTRAEAQEKTAA